MKIKQQSAQQLILVSPKNSFLKRFFFFLFATPFLGAGLFVMLEVGKVSILQCDRPLPEQISCVLTRQNLLRKNTINLSTGQLKQAELGISRGDDSDTYRVNLITDEGIIPLNNNYSSGLESKRNNVNKINQFIQDSSLSNLTVIQDDRWFGYLFGGVFALVGGGLMIFSLTFFIQTDCVFDKRKKRIFLNKKNLFKTKFKDYKISEIKAIEIVDSRDSDGDVTYYVDVIFINKYHLKLDITGGFAGCEEVVNRLNKFLDLPPTS